jgi:hypothetical protein
MKKITILFVMLFCLVGYSQQKSTGNIILAADMTANLTLNNSTKKVTLELSGPTNAWFAVHFGHFAAGQGMRKGDDFVCTNIDQSGVIDGFYEGGYFPPNVDATNNWTVLSSDIILGVRKIKIQRDFIGDGVNDFDFKYSDTKIDFAWAKANDLAPSMTIAYHGGDNFGYAFSNSFSTLGVEDFSLNFASIYPNPSNGNFKINSHSTLTKLDVYSQVGSFIKSVEFENNSNQVEVNLKELQAGVYLIELQSAEEKVWKKLIIE